MLTNDSVLDKSLRLFRSAGIVRNGPNVSVEPWRAEMMTEGFNYKMNEMEAALGTSQLARVDDFIRLRGKKYLQYREGLKADCLGFQNIPEDRTSAYHLLPILVDFDEIGVSKLDYFHWMKQRGVNLYSHYLPLHQHQFYSDKGPYDNLPNAERYYKQAFSYPLHTQLKTQEINYVCELINEYFGNK